jgi:predicted neutral ceramidase superfamily lipid hydrolase
LSWLRDLRSDSSEGRILPVETLLRPAGIVGVLAIALLHFLDLFDTIKSQAYIGVLYMVLIAACFVAASGLLGRRPRRAWMLAAAVAAVPFLAFVVSRSVGLPGATDDIGNWTEPLGVASLFVEFLVVAISLRALAPDRAKEGPSGRSHPTDPIRERAGSP